MNDYGSAIAFEIKNLDEVGYIEGIASSFGNVDYGNDRVVRGAFTKSIARKPAVPMLINHSFDRAVGRWGKQEETDAGLRVEGKISIGTNAGKEAYALAKDQVLDGLSIGYKAPGKRMVGAIRELVEVDLLEVSLVPVGMDPHARITGVKSDDAFSRWMAGVRPQRRELERYLKDGFGVSNSEAERMANALLNEDRGGRDDAEALAFLKGMAG